MIIKDIDALKSWLIQTLTPVCNADAATLAKYVVALIKKDMDAALLKDLCIDQLAVFLHEKCASFVDELFASLESNSYIPLGPAPPTTIASTPATIEPPKLETVVKLETVPPTESLPFNDRIKTEIKTEPIEATENNNKEGPRRRHSRSLSPRTTTTRRGNNERAADDRRRRYDTRGRHYGRDERRWRSRSRSPRQRSPRRYNKDKTRRSPQQYTRSRSKTPPPYGHKDDLRKLISGPKHAPPPIIPNRDSRSPTPIAENGTRFDPTLAPSTSGSISVMSNMTDYPRSSSPRTPPRPRSPMRPRLRCRDYDEKGYCMRGDMCPFDHGSDPLVVEEIDMPTDIPYGPKPPGSGAPPLPPGILPVPPGAPPGPPPMGPRPPPMSFPPVPHVPFTGSGAPPLPPGILPGPPGAPPGPPPMGPRPPPMPFPPVPISDVYNPEDPGITPPRMPLPPPFWVPPPIGIRPPMMPPPPRFPPLQPPPPAMAPMQDDLLVKHSRSETLPPEAIPQNLNRLVLPPKHHQTQSITRTTPANDGPVSHTSQSSNPKQPFDFNRLGMYRKSGYNPANMTLEVRKIPREFNTILKLNEHFSKFGTLVNVQVSYNNDPEAALVTYSRHCDAQSAYRSSTPLFQNRFIKVFWYTPDENATPAPDTTKAAVKPRITLPPSHKLQLNKKIPPTDKTTDKPVVYSTTLGNIKRTVFNHPTDDTATSTVPTISGEVSSTENVLTVPAVVKPDKTQQKATALKKNLEIQKQKQELLKKYIDQQKLLISKVETKKTVEEKASVMKTIKLLADKIEQLKLELAPKKAPASKTVTDTKRELLDAELDLINKENSGLDTTDLRVKLNQLQKQASSMGLMGARGRGRGRGFTTRGGVRGRRGSFSFMRGQKRLNNASRTIDRRSKQMEVSGFDSSTTKDNLHAHLTQHGAIENITYNEAGGSALVTFKTRMDAEKASVKGVHFGEELLQMRWHQGAVGVEVPAVDVDVPLIQFADDSLGLEGEGVEIDEEALLAPDDEDEEDDSESRSWRR